MEAYDKIILDKLLEISKKYANCYEEYNNIVSICSKTLMSKGTDLYGMFWPDMEMSKYISYSGRLTNNEEKKDFAYYFDTQDRLRITETYDEHNICNLTFYYYYDDITEFVWYDINRKTIIISGFLEYNNGKLIRFVESSNIPIELRYFDTLNFYRAYLFDVDEKYVIYRQFSYKRPLTMTKPAITIGKILKDNTPVSKFPIIPPKKVKRKIKMKDKILSLIKKSIKNWNKDEIYVVSLLSYDDTSTPTFTLGYNTISNYVKSIDSAWDEKEAKWNYAFWLQNEELIFGEDSTKEIVEDWIKSNNFDEEDDEKIFLEFKKVLVEVVKELHSSGYIKNQFGKSIPVIIHELEYYDEIAKLNIEANSYELVKEFVEFCSGN